MNSIQAINAKSYGYRVAPLRPADGRATFYYCLGDVPLTCEIYWESAEKQTQLEPGWPAQATLESADCSGINIAEILSDAQCEEIQTAFLEQEA